MKSKSPKGKFKVTREVVEFNGTADFQKLKLLPFNRECGPRADLMDSMNKYGFIGTIILIRTDVVDGTLQTWIADGQNRAYTAAHLNIPFYGEIVEGNFKNTADVVEFVASRNATQRKWQISDYIKSYAFLQIENYKILQRVTKSSGYSLQTIATMLCSTNARYGSSIDKTIRNGAFKVNFLDKTISTLRIAAKASVYSRMSSRMLISLHCVSFLDNFNEEKFLRKYENMIDILNKLEIKDFIPMFQSWMDE